MRLLFTSDLHLTRADSARRKLWVRFLDEIPQENDWLVLGGDIFDLFVGNKAVFCDAFADELDALKRALKRGVRLAYLEGNHDFHLQGVLANTPGDWRVEADAFTLDLEGVKIWVDHGDLVDPEDLGYRLLRVFSRSVFGRALVRLLPDLFFARFGEWSSRQSRKYNNLGRLPEARQEHTRRLFQAHASERLESGYDFVLMGHSHLPQEYRSASGGIYINLGYNSEKIPYLEIFGPGKYRQGAFL